MVHTITIICKFLRQDLGFDDTWIVCQIIIIKTKLTFLIYFLFNCLSYLIYVTKLQSKDPLQFDIITLQLQFCITFTQG